MDAISTDDGDALNRRPSSPVLQWKDPTLAHGSRSVCILGGFLLPLRAGCKGFLNDALSLRVPAHGDKLGYSGQRCL